MSSTPKLLSDKIISSYLSNIKPCNMINYDEKFNTIKKWIRSFKDGDMYKTKETSVQGPYLSEVFGEVLGYLTETKSNTGLYNQKPEQGNIVDATHADCSLGFFGK